MLFTHVTFFFFFSKGIPLSSSCIFITTTMTTATTTTTTTTKPNAWEMISHHVTLLPCNAGRTSKCGGSDHVIGIHEALQPSETRVHEGTLKSSSPPASQRRYRLWQQPWWTKITTTMMENDNRVKRYRGKGKGRKGKRGSVQNSLEKLPSYTIVPCVRTLYAEDMCSLCFKAVCTHVVLSSDSHSSCCRH